jgi:hypothetical protein
VGSTRDYLSPLFLIPTAISVAAFANSWYQGWHQRREKRPRLSVRTSFAHRVSAGTHDLETGAYAILAHRRALIVTVTNVGEKSIHTRRIEYQPLIGRSRVLPVIGLPQKYEIRGESRTEAHIDGAAFLYDALPPAALRHRIFGRVVVIDVIGRRFKSPLFRTPKASDLIMEVDLTGASKP